ncbi:MAG: LamG domain-containing protein, partial [bacterium]|nr:LamG domain-containing protein [bacterium]
MQIGRYVTGNYFRGQIAELRIWRTARTQAQILDHMHRRLTGDEADLVGVWPLADGEGETAVNVKAALPGRAPYGLEGRPLSALEVHSPYGEEAVGLAGDGSWIEIPHAPDLHFTAPDQDFTIELHLLAACDQGAGESERVVLEKWGGGGGFPYSLRYRPADGTFVFARSSGATPHPEIVTGGSFGDGCFHHLAAAKEGTTLRLYVDGELEGTTTDTVTSTIRGTSPLYLGGRARKSHFLKGVFCELRVWRRARSETEIRDAMESRLSGDEHDLAGYWPLDAADVAAEDLSIHCGLVRPQGTLTSTAAWADAVELPMLAPEDEGAVAPALEFDGARSAVTVAASEALAVTSALTVEAWVQPAAGGGSAFLSPVVSRCDATSGWELCANDQEFAFAV